MKGGGKARPRSDAPIAGYDLHTESHPPWGGRVGGRGGSGSLINTSIFIINVLNIHEP